LPVPALLPFQKPEARQLNRRNLNPASCIYQGTLYQKKQTFMKLRG